MNITREEYLRSRRRVEAYEAYNRLSTSSKDFKKLIEEMYFNDHLKDINDQLAVVDEGSNAQKALYNELKAISFFKQFLNNIHLGIDTDIETIEFYETGHTTLLGDD